MQLLEVCKKLVKEKLKDHEARYIHTLGVVEMASYLAKIYNIDEEKAQIAAYMHDYCKYDDITLANELLSDDDIKECCEYPFLYHAYMGAEFFKKYVCDDDEIYLAIRNHVFGRRGMTKLEEIIMISDYTEINRKYDDCILARNLIFEGKIDLAIFKCIEETIVYNTKKNKKIHPEQMAVYNEYKERIKL